jgi:hypothetical protein
MVHAEIIRKLGGATEIGRAIGVKPNTVQYWRVRNRIPPEFWRHLIAMPAAAEAGVTTDALTEGALPRRERQAAA